MRPLRPLLLLLTALSALSAAAPTQAAPTPQAAIVWGGERFTHAEPLAAWLQAHGVHYTAWAARHPRASRTVEHDLPTTSSPVLPPLRETASTDGRSASLTITLLCAACVVAAVASIPTAVAATRFGGRLLPIAEHRLALLGVACAIGAGALVSLFAG